MSNLNINGNISATGGTINKQPILTEKAFNFESAGKLTLGNGLTIVWGVTNEAFSGTKTINFAKPFDNACFSVVISQVRANNDDWDKTTIRSYNATGFTIVNSAYAMKYAYIAIGY